MNVIHNIPLAMVVGLMGWMPLYFIYACIVGWWIDPWCWQAVAVCYVLAVAICAIGADASGYSV